MLSPFIKPLLFTGGAALYVLTNLFFAATLPVPDDPLLRMPGTQPQDGVTLDSPDTCLTCHAGYSTGDGSEEPGNWQGSMMAHAARDPLFYACMTVAAQDAMWAFGNANAVDLCARCHFPKGWLEGRSMPTNLSAMTGFDFDGVQCDLCHRMYDPFFADTISGEREGDDWLDYWDETNATATDSNTAAIATATADLAEAGTVTFFNGEPFYQSGAPVEAGYTENGTGQYFVAGGHHKRGPFADAQINDNVVERHEGGHGMFYSRYHKSKFFCGTCHDVSNPVLLNLDFAATPRNDGETVLPSEQQNPSNYFHVERTFSEFMLSKFAQDGGAEGRGAFAPTGFRTSLPGNRIGRCQDCHMRDVSAKGCDIHTAPIRPDESTEHPRSGIPSHDLTGGNMWVPWLLASSVESSSNYDATNASLLNQGPEALTLDLTQGLGLNPDALLDGVARAQRNLEEAAEITDAAYNASTGGLTFRVQNNTGHKLITGYPEGRRMFVNVQAYQGESLVEEINPYDTTVGTLRGLPSTYAPDSPALTSGQRYEDALVYEMHGASSITGEVGPTFHFLLSDSRYKDNRIPPEGFDIAAAAERLSQPVWDGAVAPDLFTAEEYTGGYDEVALYLNPGADRIEIRLYYQTTSREYIAFLKNEINGDSAQTLPNEAYVAQSDAYFTRLRNWGDVIWDLWEHNKDVPGAAPVLMTEADVSPYAGTEVYVDFRHTGIVIGTERYPYVDVQAAAAFASPGATVRIAPGETSETPTIVDEVGLQVHGGGRATIGVPVP